MPQTAGAHVEAPRTSSRKRTGDSTLGSDVQQDDGGEETGVQMKLLLSLKEEQHRLNEHFGDFGRILHEVHATLVGIEGGASSKSMAALRDQLLHHPSHRGFSSEAAEVGALTVGPSGVLPDFPRQPSLDRRRVDSTSPVTRETSRSRHSDVPPEPREKEEREAQHNPALPSPRSPSSIPPRGIIPPPATAPHSSEAPRRASINSMASGGVGTRDLAAMLEGVDTALRTITYDDGTHRLATQQSGDSLRINTVKSNPRWKKVDVRSGNNASNALLAELCGESKSGKPFTQRLSFGIFCGMIIVVDSVVIAFETDETARTGEVAPAFEVLGYIFPIWYLLELLLRMFFTRPICKFFTEKGEWAWNLFDLILISCSIVEMVMQEVDSAQIRFVTVGRVLRALRLFRVIRVLRIIRFMTFLREFNKLVLCLASSLQTLLCVLSLMAFVIFCFSVMFVQLVTNHLDVHENFVPANRNEEELLEAFGTVGRAMISLYMAITSGRNWGELSELLYVVHPAVRASFFVYLSVSIFGLLNVVTAVFVESAMQATQNYRDLLVQEMTLKERAHVKHMKEIFKCIDTDNSGAISFEEMQAYMSDDSLHLQEYFEALDLSASDTYTLFSLLDVDGSGEVDIDEFCDGCIRLGGNAKSFDMNCMWYEQRRTNRELLKFIQHTCMCLHGLGKNSQLSERQTQELLRAIEHSSKRLQVPRRSTSSSRKSWAATTVLGSPGATQAPEPYASSRPGAGTGAGAGTGSGSVHHVHHPTIQQHFWRMESNDFLNPGGSAGTDSRCSDLSLALPPVSQVSAGPPLLSPIASGTELLARGSSNHAHADGGSSGVTPSRPAAPSPVASSGARGGGASATPAEEPIVYTPLWRSNSNCSDTDGSQPAASGVDPHHISISVIGPVPEDRPMPSTEARVWNWL